MKILFEIESLTGPTNQLFTWIKTTSERWNPGTSEPFIEGP
jgi:hypothetical protein